VDEVIYPTMGNSYQHQDNGYNGKLYFLGYAWKKEEYQRNSQS
jgi:hypothetical protein